MSIFLTLQREIRFITVGQDANFAETLSLGACEKISLCRPIIQLIVVTSQTLCKSTEQF